MYMEAIINNIIAAQSRQSNAITKRVTFPHAAAGGSICFNYSVAKLLKMQKR